MSLDRRVCLIAVRCDMRFALLTHSAVLLTACSASSDSARHDAGGRTDAATDGGSSTLDGGDDGGSPTDSGVGTDFGTLVDSSITDGAGGDGAVSCDGTMVALPYPDETAGTDRTEPPACPGCPMFSGVAASPTGTTVDVVGVSSGIPTSCHWYLQSAMCGGASGAFLPNEFGMFMLHLPLFCGTNRLQLVCESSGGIAVSTRDVVGPSCGSRDVQVTLSWGATANDMELHLIRMGAHINDSVGDCTWFTCMSVSPDWGTVGDPTDDPHKDVDNVSTFGPENIFLTRAPDGTYEVMVEYWGHGTADTSEIAITLGGVTVWRGSRLMTLYEVWDVGTLAFPAATFTPVDTITDCTASWRTGGSYGCALPIP